MIANFCVFGARQCSKVKLAANWLSEVRVLNASASAPAQVLGGDGWLGFMGNEFGHPEWMDFPRRGF
jgi:hypothetical protein